MNKENKLTPEEKYFTNRYACMPYNLPTNFGTTEVITMLKEFGQQEYNRGKTEAQQWISVEERLPEEKTLVLCINNYGRFRVADYEEYTTINSEAFKELFTHWMPLPSAPTQGKEKEEL